MAFSRAGVKSTKRWPTFTSSTAFFRSDVKRMNCAFSITRVLSHLRSSNLTSCFCQLPSLRDYFLASILVSANKSTSHQSCECPRRAGFFVRSFRKPKIQTRKSTRCRRNCTMPLRDLDQPMARQDARVVQDRKKRKSLKKATDDFIEARRQEVKKKHNEYAAESHVQILRDLKNSYRCGYHQYGQL